MFKAKRIANERTKPPLLDKAASIWDDIMNSYSRDKFLRLVDAYNSVAGMDDTETIKPIKAMPSWAKDEMSKKDKMKVIFPKWIKVENVPYSARVDIVKLGVERDENGKSYADKLPPGIIIREEIKRLFTEGSTRADLFKMGFNYGSVTKYLTEFKHNKRYGKSVSKKRK